MLVDPKLKDPDGFMAELLSVVTDGDIAPESIATGVIKINHFSLDMFLAEPFEDYYEEEFGYGDPFKPYGVCDYWEQIIAQWPDLALSPTRYAISITEVRKADQLEHSGGWRWEKWGQYIGTKNPQCEYLYDEPEIDSVLVYHVYRLR